MKRKTFFATIIATITALFVKKEPETEKLYSGSGTYSVGTFGGVLPGNRLEIKSSQFGYKSLNSSEVDILNVWDAPGEEILRITSDGKVIINDKIETNEAAKKFWKAIEIYCPVYLKHQTRY